MLYVVTSNKCFICWLVSHWVKDAMINSGISDIKGSLIMPPFMHCVESQTLQQLESMPILQAYDHLECSSRRHCQGPQQDSNQQLNCAWPCFSANYVPNTHIALRRSQCVDKAAIVSSVMVNIARFVLCKCDNMCLVTAGMRHHHVSGRAEHVP